MSKIKFKFLEHRADAKFQAFGDSFEEAFANAALAMTSIMIDYKRVKPKLRQKISVKGFDIKNLLYNFLEQILFLIDTKNFIIHQIRDVKIKGNTLTATLLGDNLKKYETKSDVKAVTYNEMIVNSRPFFVQVVVDV